jgi:putative transposase
MPATSRCTGGAGGAGAGRLGIDVDGKPVFVGLAPAASESTDAWTTSSPTWSAVAWVPRCGDQRWRGRADGRVRPGVPGQPAAAVPGASRNVLAKVSAHDQSQVKAEFWAIFDVGDAEPV